MKKCHRRAFSGKILIVLGLLGFFFYTFPNLLLWAAILLLVAGILCLP